MFNGSLRRRILTKTQQAQKERLEQIAADTAAREYTIRRRRAEDIAYAREYDLTLDEIVK